MDIKEKLSALVSTPVKSFNRIGNCLNYIHTADLFNEMQQGKEIYEIELFEGKLFIKAEDDKVKYKFVPNEEFNELMKKTIIDEKPALETVIVEKLREALEHTYKDLF